MLDRLLFLLRFCLHYILMTLVSHSYCSNVVIFCSVQMTVYAVMRMHHSVISICFTHEDCEFVHFICKCSYCAMRNLNKVIVACNWSDSIVKRFTRYGIDVNTRRQCASDILWSSSWHGTAVSWTHWSSRSAGSTVSNHQSLGGPDIQAFRGRWPQLSGFSIADVEWAAQRRCNGAVTANLPAPTEDTPLPSIISRYSDYLTSLLTLSVVLVVTLVTQATPL